MFRSTFRNTLMSNNLRFNNRRGFANIRRADNSDISNKSTKGAKSQVKSININNDSIYSIYRKYLNNYLSNKTGDTKHTVKATNNYKPNTAKENELSIKFKDKFSNLSNATSKLENIFKYSIEDTTANKVSNVEKDAQVATNYNKTEEAKSKELKNIYNSIYDFVSTYNDAMSFLNYNSSNIEALNPIAQSYKSTINGKRTQLNVIGISISSDNKMTIDSDKLMNSLKNNKDSVKHLFSDSNSGLAKNIYSKSKTVANHSDDLFYSTMSRNLKNSSYNSRNHINSYAKRGLYFNDMIY